MYTSPAEISKSVKDTLKANFPTSDGWKFSVRKEVEHGMCSFIIKVSILKSPYEFRDNDSLNRGHIKVHSSCIHLYKHSNVLSKLLDIANRNNWRDKNPKMNYFDYNYTLKLELGKSYQEPFTVNHDQNT